MIEDIIQRNGFVLIKETRIPEIDGSLFQMEHVQTGAQLVWLNRPDENMTFSIGFRTIPTDSTGVFHILEHSVLCGSNQYPVKEPFLELLKSSLQTFLNAMTFPDKTLYPVSSKNRRDFINLISVYMDAVLHPLAVHDPRIFQQEGWRIEFQNDSETPVFQGVVYNEMKGALSNVRSVTEHVMMRHLFPDTCYRHESGGNPALIPELTFEQFQSEHARYYHPSNAMIALDGSIDLNSCLSLLNKSFGPYERLELNISIPMQQPLPFSRGTIPYEIGANENTAGRTIVSYGKLLCDFRDPVRRYSAFILAEYLSDGSEAPLRRAILDAGLGEDASARLHDGLQQYWFGWEVVNTDPDCVERIQDAVKQLARDILKNGFDRDRLLGCYNSLAFSLTDRDSSSYPRGLSEILSMDSWYYGGNPAEDLSYMAVLRQLRDNMETGYFEELLQNCLLDDSTGFLAVMVPSTELGSTRLREEDERVRKYWNHLSIDQKLSTRNSLIDLHKWQQEPNSPEALASIPVLNLSDIDPVPMPLDYSITKHLNTPCLIHNVSTKICYINLFFCADDLPADDIPLAGLLADSLGLLATGHFTASGLQNAINQKIGRFSTAVEIYSLTRTTHHNLITVRAACLADNLKETVNLITEILLETKYSDTSALSELIKRKKISAYRSIVSAGNRYAAVRVQSRQSSAGAAKELLSGYESILRLHKASTFSTEEYAELMIRMSRLAQKLFVRERLTISISDNCADILTDIISAMPHGVPCSAASACYPIAAFCREGIQIPAAIGFSAKGFHLDMADMSYSGSMYVLSNYLTYEYLWNTIRVQGGAYGTSFRISPTGEILFTSYRDPSPARSISEFNRSCCVVDALSSAKPDLTKFILGAVNDADPLMSSAHKIQRAEARFFRGNPDELSERLYRELLSATIDDLQAAIPPLKALAECQNYCILGGEQQLADCSDQLDQVLTLP